MIKKAEKHAIGDDIKHGSGKALETLMLNTGKMRKKKKKKKT
jgi:hypothetical protein